MDQTKEDLIESIQQLRAQRRQCARKLKVAVELMQERDAELPAYNELEQAKAEVKRLKAKLDDQCAQDETYQTRSEKVTEARDDLATVDSSLSTTLVLYATKTKKLHVHADADEAENEHREIRISASFGRKVNMKPDNLELDLFGESEGSSDAQA